MLNQSRDKIPRRVGVTNQSVIVWTLKTKSLLPSLYKREELPLFAKEGLGEIFGRICLFHYGLLSIGGPKERCHCEERSP